MWSAVLDDHILQQFASEIIPISTPDVSPGEIGEGIMAFWLQHQGLLVLLNRIIELAGDLEHEAKIVVGLGVIGQKFGRILELPGGFIVTALEVIQLAEIVVPGRRSSRLQRP